MECPYCKEELDEPHKKCKFCGWSKKIDFDRETILNYLKKEFNVRIGNKTEDTRTIREKLERIMKLVKENYPELFTVLSFIDSILTNQDEILSFSNLIMRNQQRVNSALELIFDNIIKDLGK